MNLNSYDDSTYTAYYRDVGKYNVLTANEERELFRRYHTCPHCHAPFQKKIRRTNCPTCGLAIRIKVATGTLTCTKCSAKFDTMVVPKNCQHCGSSRDNEARELLIVSNLRFVIKRAHKLTADPKRRQLLVSAGNVGLMLAVDKYNPDRETRFLTYAEWWIRKEMYDAINSSPLVHIPPQKRRALLKEKKEGKYICVHCGARSDSSDNAYDVVCTAKEHQFEAPDTASSSLLGNGITLDKTILASDDAVEDTCIAGNMQESIRHALRTMSLSERDRYILLGYYDVAEPDRKSEPKNLGQLAALLGVTPERVRQLKKKVLNKVRRKLVQQAFTTGG